MKRLIMLLLCLTIAGVGQASFAGLFPKPSLKKVNGQVHSNRKDIDLSLIKVEETIICLTGWGDGQHSCGEKTIQVMADKDGRFFLPELKGENSNWFRFRYKIYYADTPVFSSRYPHRIDESKNAIAELLTNFSIVYLDSYNLHLTTDIGVDFLSWLKNENDNLPIGYSVKLMLKNINKEVVAILPESSLMKGITENDTLLPAKSYLLPGELKQALDNSIVDIIVQSREGGIYRSVLVSHKSFSLGDKNIIKELSTIDLAISKINYIFEGTWQMNISVDIPNETTGHVFISSEPSLTLVTHCEDKTLTGYIELNYYKHREMNQTKKLIGTCDKGEATFSLDVVLIDYGTQNMMEFNFNIIIEGIAGDGSEYPSFINLKDNKRYTSFSSPVRRQSTEGQ